MVSSNSKGDRRERELVRLLSGEHEKSPFDEDEWAPMRAPASGSATERELPDIFAGYDGILWAIEAKTSNGDPIYIDEEEVEDLQYFAARWGAYARIGARFDDNVEWRFFNPNALYRTPEGNYRVKQEDFEETPNQTLEDLASGPL